MQLPPVPALPSRSCQRLARVSDTSRRRRAATGAWVPQACSGFSWLSSRQGSSVSREGERGGRDATVWVREDLLAAMQSRAQSEKAGAVPNARLPPARSGGSPGSLGPRGWDHRTWRLHRRGALCDVPGEAVTCTLGALAPRACLSRCFSLSDRRSQGHAARSTLHAPLGAGVSAAAESALAQ